MRKVLILSMALIAMFVTSCDLSQSSNPAKFYVAGSVTEGDVIEFIVTAENQKADYIVGLIDQTILNSIGGQSGLVDYVGEIIANTPDLQILNGPSTHPYPGLQPIINWYLYVAQVSNGKLVGTPELSNATRIYTPYVEYISKEWIIPQAISDNGLWLVGAATGNTSYIIDRIYDKTYEDVKVITGAALHDVSDNGVAYGEDVDGQKPMKYEDGNLEVVTLFDGSEGAVNAVSPDGSKYYGYYMAESLQNAGMRPFVCENGVYKDLSIEGGKSLSYIDDDTQDTAYCYIKGAVVVSCASNGVLAGYGLDDGPMFEQSVFWSQDGKMKVIGEGRMHYHFEWSAPAADYVYGNKFTYVSPNGKYISGICTKSYDEIGSDVLMPYLYNVETGELFLADEDQCAAYSTLRVDCVTSDGLVCLSDVVTQLAENPLVWTPESGLMLLELYLENIYGSIEPEMKGSVATTTLDGKTFVLGYDTEEGTKTSIYTF